MVHIDRHCRQATISRRLSIASNYRKLKSIGRTQNPAHIKIVTKNKRDWRNPIRNQFLYTDYGAPTQDGLELVDIFKAMTDEAVKDMTERLAGTSVIKYDVVGRIVPGTKILKRIRDGKTELVYYGKPYLEEGGKWLHSKGINDIFVRIEWQYTLDFIKASLQVNKIVPRSSDGSGKEFDVVNMGEVGFKDLTREWMESLEDKDVKEVQQQMVQDAAEEQSLVII